MEYRTETQLPDTPPPPYHEKLDSEVPEESLYVTLNLDDNENVADKESDVNSIVGATPGRDSAASDDPWALPEFSDTGPRWSELSTKQKFIRAGMNITKIVLLLGLLYLFVCSLTLLSDSFRLLSGEATDNVMSDESIVGNPIVGLMIGILLTVLVQSSSTSTSIIVSMVAASMLSVSEAIPMVMGSNIGTSVTNTIVSMTQAGDREQFRRAFAGATIHDMFNWLTVIVMLSIEISSGFLEFLTDTILDATHLSQTNGSTSDLAFLEVITEPFTDKILQIDNDVLEGWSTDDPAYDDARLLKVYCEYNTTELPYNISNGVNSTCCAPFCDFDCTPLLLSNGTLNVVLSTYKYGTEKCDFLLNGLSEELDDWAIGLIGLAIALLMLCGCLILIVKILHSMLKGAIAGIIRKTLNADIPYVPWLTGYIAIFVGMGMTILVQSSSIFTSALTPLVGLGVISLERMYPLTLGSNIGTTTTAMLAAFAADASQLRYTIQIAMVHLFFNIFGILIFYPIPFMRWPIPMAKRLGNTTANYRWFAVVYLVLMFFLLPLFVFGLSQGGVIAMYVIGLPLVLILVLVAIINVLQHKVPSLLPNVLRNWDFLPLWLHSLQPYDKVFSKLLCCKSCNEVREEEDKEILTLQQTPEHSMRGVDNKAAVL